MCITIYGTIHLNYLTIIVSNVNIKITWEEQVHSTMMAVVYGKITVIYRRKGSNLLKIIYVKTKSELLFPIKSNYISGRYNFQKVVTSFRGSLPCKLYGIKNSLGTSNISMNGVCLNSCCLVWWTYQQQDDCPSACYVAWYLR